VTARHDVGGKVQGFLGSVSRSVFVASADDTSPSLLPEVPMNGSTITPMSCPVCRRSALMQESTLLRLPHTVLFRCPYCRTIAVVDTTLRHRSPSEGGEAAAA
jgi:hypothetical protein